MLDMLDTLITLIALINPMLSRERIVSIIQNSDTRTKIDSVVKIRKKICTYVTSPVQLMIFLP